MRRILMWFLSTVTVVVLMFGYHTSTSGAMNAASETVIPASADPGSASTPGASATAAATTVAGPVVATQWGPVQVQVSTDAGTITDVTVLQYPNSNPRDQQINAYALPILVQATLDAQSADVDMVSGATVTSDGYLRSLQAALDEAGL